MDLMKINVDVAVGRGDSHGVVGVVCTDQTYMFMGASTNGFPNISDPATLESLAIRKALALVDNLYVRMIN